jgi:DNA ligase-1
MRFADLVQTSLAVTETRARSSKIERLAACLSKMSPDEISVGVAFLSGELTQGKIGLGYATVRGMAESEGAGPYDLELLDVDRRFGEIAVVSGAGSSQKRTELLADLFRRAGPAERDFLKRLIVGELRQGALEGILVEAIASAFRIDAALIRRAIMLSGDARRVARTIRERGSAGLDEFRLELGRPLQPMLAQPAEDVASALSGSDEIALEYKLDGARIQVHKVGTEVRVFTRSLLDVTSRVPEIVDAVGRLPATRVVLDGEAIALRADGRPQPFQTTMRRFGKKLELGQLRHELPISSFFFDCLHLEGEDLIDRSLAERSQVMSGPVTRDMLVERRIVHDSREAEAFLAEALSRGHEGVMAKVLSAPYEAGRRGASWLKVKPAHTLDLVVLAVEWGSGRRRGFLSNLHLGARDPTTGGFVMLGKTFKGMTDAMLKWQTEKLLSLEVSRTDWVVHVKPELVVEIAFDGVQASQQYPGGMALRFARVKRYREDKVPSDADTVERVRAIFEGVEGSRRGA